MVADVRSRTDRRLSANAAYDAVEVCAGAGGQAIGLHYAGFAHRALVEIEPAACETLRLNAARLGWGDIVHQADLHTWPQAELLVDMKGVSLLAGGVPCPPFSMAGKQLGADDERDLFPRMLDLVAMLDPRAVLIENVRGLMSTKFDGYRANVDVRLRNLGYVPAWRLLQASDYGVAQLRPRTIMVALRPNDAAEFVWPEAHPEAAPTVGDVLYESMASRGWKGAKKWAAGARGVAPTLVGGSKKHGGPDLGPTRARQGWAALGVDGIGLANELPDNSFSGVPKITVAQAALIQGFPPDWQIHGRKTAAYRQVGNAFPPPVAEAVGRQISKALAAADDALATPFLSINAERLTA
jgi:DNA (cytosine-5)-methyltransferase 1